MSYFWSRRHCVVARPHDRNELPGETYGNDPRPQARRLRAAPGAKLRSGHELERRRDRGRAAARRGPSPARRLGPLCTDGVQAGAASAGLCRGCARCDPRHAALRLCRGRQHREARSAQGVRHVGDDPNAEVRAPATSPPPTVSCKATCIPWISSTPSDTSANPTSWCRRASLAFVDATSPGNGSVSQRTSRQNCRCGWAAVSSASFVHPCAAVGFAQELHSGFPI